MRRLMVVAATAALVGGAAMGAVMAATGGGVTPVNCMASVWQTTEVSTSSTAFVNVPGFSDTPVAIYPIAINVSALVSGAPAEFRVLSTDIGGVTHGSQPGRTRFAPAGGLSDTFAYQWIEVNQSAATHANSLVLQWRSLTGGAVHMLRGDMAVSYSTDACQGA